MNIPSPAVVKKQIDERLAKMEKEKHESLPRHRPESSKKRDFTTSPSSQKEKGSKDRSSSSRRPNKSSTKFSPKAGGSSRESDEKVPTGKSNPSTKSTRTSTTSPEAGRKDRGSISTTPRKSSSTKSTSNDESKSKKEFVRPNHLTQKPFRDNDALQSLRKELEKPARGQFKREYRSNARQSGKNTALKNMKESN